jgi:hypothetical protein
VRVPGQRANVELARSRHIHSVLLAANHPVPRYSTHASACISLARSLSCTSKEPGPRIEKVSGRARQAL